MSGSERKKAMESPPGEDLQLLGARQFVVELPLAVTCRQVPGGLFPLVISEVLEHLFPVHSDPG